MADSQRLKKGVVSQGRTRMQPGPPRPPLPVPLASCTPPVTQTSSPRMSRMLDQALTGAGPHISPLLQRDGLGWVMGHPEPRLLTAQR